MECEQDLEITEMQGKYVRIPKGVIPMGELFYLEKVLRLGE